MRLECFGSREPLSKRFIQKLHRGLGMRIFLLDIPGAESLTAYLDVKRSEHATSGQSFPYSSTLPALAPENTRGVFWGALRQRGARYRALRFLSSRLAANCTVVASRITYIATASYT